MLVENSTSKKKKHNYFFFAPGNLDIDQFLKECPPAFRYERDYFVYVMHLIYQIPYYKHDLQAYDGFVPISGKKLQEVVAGYKKYIRHLIDNHVIISDNYYIKGVKCLGYKFTKQFSRGFQLVTMVEEHIVEKVRKKKNSIPTIDEKEEKKYKHVTKHLESADISIDYEGAKSYMNHLTDQRMQEYEACERKVITTLLNVLVSYKVVSLPVRNDGTKNIRTLGNAYKGPIKSFLLTNLKINWKNKKSKGDDRLIFLSELVNKAVRADLNTYNLIQVNPEENNFTIQDLEYSIVEYGKLQNPLTRHYAATYAIEKVRLKDFSWHIDSTSYRLHTCLTNMPKEIRNYITYKGQRLISCDLKNSQPYLSTILSNYKFWIKDYTNQSLNIYSINFSKNDIMYNIVDNVKGYYYKESGLMTEPSNAAPVIRVIEKKLKEEYSKENQLIISKEDWIKYRNIVSAGIFYEEMGKEIFAVDQERKSILRGDVKKLMYAVMFSSNNWFHQKGARDKQLFDKIFPNVYCLFEIIKESDSSALAVLLQTIESHIFLKIVTKRIAKGRPNIFFLTIHDSIISTEDNIDYVKQVMEEELTRVIGLKPSIQKEYWQKDEANCVDLSTCFTNPVAESSIQEAVVAVGKV